MPTYKFLYSDKSIYLILKKLNLKPEISPKDFINLNNGIKHRYYTVCYQNSKKRFFYCLLKKDKKNQIKFLKEINLANILIKNKSKNIFTHFPTYLKTSSLKENPKWLLLEWLPYPVLEDKKQAELSIHQLEFKETKIFSNLIIKISNIIKKLEKEIYLEKFNLNLAFYKIKEKLRMIANTKIISQKKINKLQKDLVKDFKIWGKEIKYFCHGDLHLGNIVYYKNKKTDFKIIDWEVYHVNNFAYDISFFFSRLWREAKIRRNLLLSYISLLPKNKIDLFKRLFKINLVYFSLTYGLDSSPIEFTKNQVKTRQLWFKKLLLGYFEDFNYYLKI